GHSADTVGNGAEGLVILDRARLRGAALLKKQLPAYAPPPSTSRTKPSRSCRSCSCSPSLPARSQSRVATSDGPSASADAVALRPGPARGCVRRRIYGPRISLGSLECAREHP